MQLAESTTGGRNTIGLVTGLVLIGLLVLVVGVLSPPAAAEDFDRWLMGVRRDAAAAGISAAILDRAFAGLAPIERVIELDRAQPETRLSFDEYVDRVVPPARVAAARARIDENRGLLTEVATRYRVQPRFIVALWGIETDFGRNTGGYPVIASLATLAFEGRRAEFFRSELMAALRILDQGNIAPEAMIGSWAGAMGQSQFMPSSFIRYAVDFDRDGRRDIWQNRGDIFASIANYLANVGWRDDQDWGREVAVPADLDPAMVGLETIKPLAQWQEIGVRRLSGMALPTTPLIASLVQPDGRPGRSFLVYDNFRATLKWNRSTYFAVAVGLLADSL